MAGKKQNPFHLPFTLGLMYQTFMYTSLETSHFDYWRFGETVTKPSSANYDTNADP